MSRPFPHGEGVGGEATLTTEILTNRHITGPAIAMPINQLTMRKLSDAHLSQLLDHTYRACQMSAAALQNALSAHIRQEPMPMPIWALREAHSDNLNRFEAILAEMERRQIP